MTKLDEVLDTALLGEMLEQGYVRQQVHPDLPLRIFNYSEKAQYERVWNTVTRQCRGLIVENDTDEIVARPFRKFFNHGEAEGPDALDLSEPVEVTDKLDGSLGILYPAGRGTAIATRGSFASDQALHATEVWRSRYSDTRVSRDWTLLFEIVYPENRIVVDYGGQDDLILLGAREIATGRSIGPGAAAALSGWSGPVAEVFTYRTLADALAAPPREDMEGLVVRSLATDTRVKIKYERYVYLHRLVTGMNERVVWERIGEGETVVSLVADLPDEFHGWVEGVAARLLADCDSEAAAAQAEHHALVARMPEGWTRKEYAEVAKRSERRALLFLLLDGRDPKPSIWRDLRPSGAVSMVAMSEAVA